MPGLAAMPCHSFQKAKVLAEKRERERSNHKAEEGAGEGGGGIDTPATEARTDKADNKAPSQSSVAKSDNPDARLRKKLEELTVEMRAKFALPKSAPTTTTTATSTSTRPDNVTPTAAPSRTCGSVESIEERVKRDIEHAQKIIREGTASSSSAEVEVNSDRVKATATPTSSKDGNVGTLRSTNASVINTPTRTHAPSIGAASVATIEESPDIPVRDTSGQLTKESDKLKLMVSEVYARHQSDLEAIRNSNLGIDLPSTLTQRRQRKQQQEQQALLDAFSAKRSGSTASHPAAKAMPPPPSPTTVPKANATVIESGDNSGGCGGGNGGHLTPHMLHRADPSSDDAATAAAAAGDPFNFMATARRTFDEATSMYHRAQVHHQQEQQGQQSLLLASEAPRGNVALSEGPLSTSWVSSTGAGGGGEGEGEGANREGGGIHAASSNAEAAVGGAVKKALVGKGKKSKRRGSGGSGKEPSHPSRGPANEQKSVSAPNFVPFYRFNLGLLFARLFPRRLNFASWLN